MENKTTYFDYSFIQVKKNIDIIVDKEKNVSLGQYLIKNLNEFKHIDISNLLPVIKQSNFFHLDSDNKTHLDYILYCMSPSTIKQFLKKRDFIHILEKGSFSHNYKKDHTYINTLHFLLETLEDEEHSNLINKIPRKILDHIIEETNSNTTNSFNQNIPMILIENNYRYQLDIEILKKAVNKTDLKHKEIIENKKILNYIIDNSLHTLFDKKFIMEIIENTQNFSQQDFIDIVVLNREYELNFTYEELKKIRLFLNKKNSDEEELFIYMASENKDLIETKNNIENLIENNPKLINSIYGNFSPLTFAFYNNLENSAKALLFLGAEDKIDFLFNSPKELSLSEFGIDIVSLKEKSISEIENFEIEQNLSNKRNKRKQIFL